MNTSPTSRLRLVWIALVRLFAGVIFIGALIFLPAGTFDYWQAWLYSGVLLGPMLLIAIVLLINDPAMLERRMTMRETQAQQKWAVAGLTLLLFAIYIVSAIDWRFGWSSVPPVLIFLADLVILVSFGLFALTIRENQFAARVVEVQSNQRVISSGPYALVRHPMYLATALMFCVTPLALGSYWGLIVSLLFPVMLIPRIYNEEKVLHEGLRGYDEYTHKVRYRLIPFVW